MRASLISISAFQLFGLSAVTQAETFPAANGLERSLVAKDPMIKNAISVSVDVDGTIYATESARRQFADLDIRQFKSWVKDDVALTSIEEKRAFFETQLDGKNQFPKTSLKDQNSDGKIDIKDLTAITEKVIRITDKDGDGIYDTSNVFAEDFNTEITGIAAGVLAWRGDVYATIAPDLWKLRDTNGDGKADQRESLAHGFGLHIAYAGHDMHGLILGPDGRIYWTIGDKGTNVTAKEGKKFFAPHEGSLLRCYPDGTGFEIFARGLRNPQEIAFDKYGNIFSVDNDSDQKGERERFLHITEGSDTGWRCYYQYRGSDYNPWMAENIWETIGEFQPAYITPTNMNYSDGPAGFAYNPGTALNSKYEDAFFVTEFPKGNIRSFKVKPKGATFEMTDEHVVSTGATNIGINFGPDGALYAADWAGGYTMNEKGNIWKLDDPTVVGSAIRQEVAKFLKEGTAKVSTTDLVNRLSHKDMRIRLDAQWELANRKAIAELDQVISSSTSDQLAKIHAMWALSQQHQFFEAAFQSLAISKDPILRAQAAKHAGETLKGSDPILTKLLADPDPQVRFQAATAIWKIGDATAIDAVIKMLAENDNQDAYLRHAGVLALSASPAAEIAAKTLTHASPAVRLAAAVAFRRLNSPLAAELLKDKDPQVVAEAAHAIYDDPAIEGAYPALAALLTDKPDATPPTIRRAIASNRRMANSAAIQALINFALREDIDADLRVAALQSLTTWDTAFVTDPVDGRHNPFPAGDKADASRAFASAAIILQGHSDPKISTAAAATAKQLGIVADESTLASQAINPKATAAARIRALEALSPRHDKLLKETATKLLKDSLPEIRSAAARALNTNEPAMVLEYAMDALKTSKDISEKQNAVLLLGSMKNNQAISVVRDLLKQALANPKKSASGYEPGLLLELLASLPKEDASQLNAALKKIDANGTYFVSHEGGNPIAGEKIFNEHLAAQCIACHRVGEEGSEVGPPLTHAGKKGRDYIFESLVAPQAKITAGYGLMSLTTKSGSSISGALKEETATSVTLILADKTETIVKTSDIATRTQPISMMPPMGEILSPSELRDIIAYLAGLE